MADRTVSVRLQANVADYMTKMSAAGKATGDLANKVDTATGKSKQGFDIIGRSALVMGGAALAGFGIAVKASMDFDKEMSQLKAASGAGEAAMGDLRDAAIQAGKDTVFSASEAAQAETALAKAGVKTADILGGALTGTVNLAAAGQLDLAEAAEISASAMTQFGLKGSDVSHIADLLAAGAGKAQGSVHDLGMALSQSGLVASQAGLTIEEATGGLAAFASAGLIGSDAGTSFKTMLQRLNPQSAEAAGLMDDLNLSAYDAQGNFIGLSEYAGKLRHSLKDMSQEQRNAALQTLFGSDAVRAAAVLYNEGAKGVQKWEDAVNDAGYAQAFAATALDNLSGDLEQLRGSIETALIQSGGKANGILREMVQTVTGVVNVYNDLPGPVQAAATGLVAVGGAVTFAGGAALLFIPKWVAMNAALEASGRSAVTARGAIGMLGKGIGAGAGIFAAYEGVTMLKGALDGTRPSVERFTSALTQMGAGGELAGEQILGTLTALANMNGPVDFLPGYVKNLDSALAGLVSSGKADLAADDFDRMSKALEATGMTTEEVTALFPAYGGALRDSAAQAKLAGTGIDDYGNAVGDAAEQTKLAESAVEDYKDALHSLADPLFAMNDALAKLKEAQHAASKATRKYGADSKQARQANLELASSALDVKTAAADLATAVATGAVSLRDAKNRLHDWTEAGIITAAQAKNIAAQFKNLIGRGKELSDLHPKIKVDADISDAMSNVRYFERYLRNIPDERVQIIAYESGPGHSIQRATGGAVFGPGTGTSDSIPAMLSNGEFVVTADGSNLNDAMRFFGAAGFADGGPASRAMAALRGVDSAALAKALLAGHFMNVLERAGDRLGEKAAAAFDRIARPLVSSLDRLNNVVAAARDYRASTRESLTSYADVSGAAGSGVGVMTYAQAKVNDLKKFAHLYNKLEHKGLHPHLLGEFMAAGPPAIPAMEQLLHTPHGIHRLNRLDTQAGRISSRLAGQATADQYGPKIEAALNGLPGPIGHAVGRAVAKELRGMRFVMDDGGRYVYMKRRTG